MKLGRRERLQPGDLICHTRLSDRPINPPMWSRYSGEEKARVLVKGGARRTVGADVYVNCLYAAVDGDAICRHAYRDEEPEEFLVALAQAALLGE